MMWFRNELSVFVVLATLFTFLGAEVFGQSLTWDSLSKHYNSKRGETNAFFVFNVMNQLSNDVTVNAVHPSCGCTIPIVPDLPWRIQPGEEGQVLVDVDLRGRTGLLTKTISIGTSLGTNVLVVNVKFPELTEREKNQRRAFTDRQAVFKTGCAECHRTPATGKTGKALFKAACGICHEAEHRAEMVSDLGAVERPTDSVYWEQWIRNGKPGTFMPAFSKRYGGPLSDEQIGSLVTYLTARKQTGPAKEEVTGSK